MSTNQTIIKYEGYELFLSKTLGSWVVYINLNDEELHSIKSISREYVVDEAQYWIDLRIASLDTEIQISNIGLHSWLDENSKK